MKHAIVEQAVKIAYGNVSDYYFTPEGEAQKISDIRFFEADVFNSEALRDPDSRRANLESFLGRVRQLSDQEAGLPAEVRNWMCTSIHRQFDTKCANGLDQQAMETARELEALHMNLREACDRTAEEARKRTPDFQATARDLTDEQLAALLGEEFERLSEEIREQLRQASQGAVYSRCHLRHDQL